MLKWLVKMVKKSEKANKKDNEEKKESKYVKLRHGSNIVIESVMAKGKGATYTPHFLVYYRKQKRWELRKLWELEDLFLLPLERHMYSYEPYVITPQLFRKLNEGHCLSKEELLKKSEALFDKFMDCDEEYKILGATIVFLSYQQCKVEVLPIIFITGDPGSGKSRYNESVAYQSYRAFLTTDLRPANYYDEIGLDKADEGTSTICIENADHLYRQYETMLLLKAGRRKRKPVRRIIDPSKKTRSKRYYPTYALAVVDAEDSPYDPAFQRRLILIVLVEGEPEEEVITENHMKHEFNPLKVEFLIYRMKHFWDKLPNVDERLKELGVKTSVKERWLGIYKTAYDLEEYRKVIEKLMEKDKTSALDRRRGTLEAYMTSTLKLFLDEAKKEPQKDKMPVLIIKFSDYWLRLAGKLGANIEDVNGKFQSPILERVITKKLVGTRLRNRFRAEPLLLRTEDGNARHYSILKSFIERSIKKYGLDKEDL